MSGVVRCNCNPLNLKAEVWNAVGSIPIGFNTPLIVGEL